MSNNILQYTSRDFDSIKKDLINAIPNLTNLWTSREDGDPGIVLVKLMSALGDMLSFNFDKQALEYYGPTVTQRKNAAKLFELIGYKMHWYRAATTTVSLTYQPVLEEDISFYKRIADGESPVDVYYDYRSYYNYNGYPDVLTTYSISVPFEISVEGLPETFVITELENELSSGQTMQEPIPITIKNNNNFKAHAALFATYAQQVFEYWVKANRIGLHTYIEDPRLSILLYSTTYSEPVYSLIPSTQSSGVENGVYQPTIYLYPYTATPLKALQGSLASTNFTTRQLKKNCFYIPDSNIDETYIFLGYKTVETNMTDQATIFVTKVDNLLTTSDGELHFQFGVDEFDYPYIELSSYWMDIIGDKSVTFTLYYFRTQGQYGNITENYIKRLNNASSLNIDITNIENTDYHVNTVGETISSPGYNPQTAADAYKDSLNYIMTYDTVVTIYDFMRFTKRQDGISNAFACDGQYAKDLNDKQRKLCNSYTKEQLITILGTDGGGLSKSQLAQCLFNIRKIMPSYKDNIATIEDALNPGPDSEFVNYSINIYPIVENYRVSDNDSEGNPYQIAFFGNNVGNGSVYPYKIYRILTSEDSGVTPDNYKIETQLDEAFENVHVANVKPFYNGCRVFDWRVCGTLHLKKAVSQEDANKIIRNVINTISTAYSVSNMQFGVKVNYMELIDIITNSDSNIRYFDAGMGTKKLIDFANLMDSTSSSLYFTPEAYFNDESIMRYAQTYDECVQTPSSQYYNYISVDPSYILVNDPTSILS